MAAGLRSSEIAFRVCILLSFCFSIATAAEQHVKVTLTWGEAAVKVQPYYIKLLPESPRASITSVVPVLLEPGEGEQDGAWQSHAGAGDVDGVSFTLNTPELSSETLSNMNIIWADLIAHSDADTAFRLGRDAAVHPRSPRLTVQMNAEGTRGFTVTMDQLLEEKSIWIPSLNVYIAAGEEPVSFAGHQRQLAHWSGERILDRVSHEPEGSYAQYLEQWEDMGNPAYTNPQQRGPGHIVGLTWDSAIPKFGIDRGAGVWNDYGNPDHFQFWFNFGDISQGIMHTWRGQHLQNGLPVVTTTFEQDGVRYEVEQFAYPLDGPPAERRGDLNMLLMQRVQVTDLEGRSRRIPITFSHRRQFPASVDSTIYADRQGDTVLLRDRAHQRVLLGVTGVEGQLLLRGVNDYQRELKRVDATFALALAANGRKSFIVELASPMIAAKDASKLASINYGRARDETLRFWSDYVSRGAQFTVPEEAVNDLFRATLWHALRLPRRHGGSGADVPIDLPYSNFAYSQTGTPWPINQSVYVDYMLYDLRGYHQLSTEELAAQFRNNQEQNGHINGFANWGAYTPGMLYAVAQNFLLSRDRTALNRLLPYSLKALDYCLAQTHTAALQQGYTRGLVEAPLNDGTGVGFWAFNQAYFYAGLDLFGRVLEEIGNPRATESREAARMLRDATERGFRTASTRSPVVQLRDHTWQPYVPSEATTYRRMMDQWYPADVDTGALHLVRLKTVPSGGELANWLLNDHEDNLYLAGRGIANEPVYNQQATAYLLRDDPKAAIRTFYSYMASAFSHSVFEPVEHRWTHGQYFGPPSTDGAWFELYRNMLIHESDDGALVLAMATPRAWLADGKKIVVERAPTYYGALSMTLLSAANAGRISAKIDLPSQSEPRMLLVRLRHPDGKPMRRVLVNGQNWADFDPDKEWVRITKPTGGKYLVVAYY